MEARLFLLQRVTAMVLAPLVAVHLIVILIAVRGGLTAAEIQARTEGNWAFAGFYAVFVIAAALHAPIGLRNVLREWTGIRGTLLDLAMVVFAVFLAGAGLRAVVAVTVGVAGLSILVAVGIARGQRASSPIS